MKNLKNIFLLASAFSMIVTSCTDYERPDFTVEQSESIALQEKINAYDGLKTYINTSVMPDFVLGADMNLADYNAKELMYRLANHDFNRLTFTEGTQHGDIVQQDGTYNLSGLQTLFDITSTNGMSVFGKNLVATNRQNATYLNKLLTPIVIENPVYPNSLSLSSLNNGAFTGWSFTGNVTKITYDNLNTVKMVSGANASNPTDLRLITPDISVVAGHDYEVIMYVRSDSNGQGRISFEGLTNDTPQLDWESNGSVSSTFSTNVRWKKLKFRISGDSFTGSTIKLHFDFGYQPNTTYYINVGSLYVYDTQSTAGSNAVWLEAECGEYGSDWQVYTSDPNPNATPASEGTYLMVPDGTKPTGGQGTIPAQNINLKFVVSQEGSYDVYVRAAALNGSASSDSFYVRMDNAGGWTDMNNRGIATNPFTWFKVNTYTLTKGAHIINTAMREDGCKIDKFYVAHSSAPQLDLTTANTTVGGQAYNCDITGFNLTRPALEKTSIIDEKLDDWIKTIVTFSKDYVKAWNVVDEPMDDTNPTVIKSGIGKTQATDQFYWQDYLGSDYAVNAFKRARANGNATDLLFISDYGLEANLAKCQGLIDYIAHIESAGAQVDGIAAKMHLTLNTNLTDVNSMFQKLTATGKKIAISDFYVQLSATPTKEELQQQADVYKAVLESYANNVPVAQRYGVFLRSFKDTSGANASGLWDKDFNRKSSFSSFADGLQLIK